MSEEQAAPKHGVKELDEALKGILAIAVFVAERAKDGLALDDGIALFDKVTNDAEFKAKVDAAIKGIELVPAEAKDLDLQEGVSLIVGLAPELIKMIEALKK